MHSDLSWRRLLHGLDDANLRFSHGQRGMKRGAAEKMRRAAAPRLV